MSSSSTSSSPPSSPSSSPNITTTTAASYKQLSLPTTMTSTLDSLLQQYSGATLPLSSRVDPSVPQRQFRPLALRDAWQYVPFFAGQARAVSTAFLSHLVHGGRRSSWGIEMSVFTAFMRDVASYSHLTDVKTVRSFINLASLIPPRPKDAIFTPVSFRVKRRGLGGILKEFDDKEDGSREVTAEWVVGERLWRRMQKQWRENGREKKRQKVILYIHGGAYYVMSATTHRPLTVSLSKYTECRLLAINYRLAPDTPFPGALHDCLSGYFYLTRDLGANPEDVVVAADSAGGGLALAMLMYLRDYGLQLPSGAILMSPWVDLTMSCDSWETNATYDYLPRPEPGDHLNPVHAYLGDNIQKFLTHPYASPIFGSFHDLPPLLIQAGDSEVLRDEITLLAVKATSAGVSVRHELYQDCVHVFQAFLFLDASRKALQSARHFVKNVLEKDRLRKQAERVRVSGGEKEAVSRVGEGGAREENKDRRQEGDGVIPGRDANRTDRRPNADRRLDRRRHHLRVASTPTPVTASVNGLKLESDVRAAKAKTRTGSPGGILWRGRDESAGGGGGTNALADAVGLEADSHRNAQVTATDLRRTRPAEDLLHGRRRRPSSASMSRRSGSGRGGSAEEDDVDEDVDSMDEADAWSLRDSTFVEAGKEEEGEEEHENKSGTRAAAASSSSSSYPAARGFETTRAPEDP